MNSTDFDIFQRKLVVHTQELKDMEQEVQNLNKVNVGREDGITTQPRMNPGSSLGLYVSTI